MLTTPSDAKPDQNGPGGLAVRLLCEVGRSAACTAHTAVRLKASGMQLPARRQDEGNDRNLEAHKITALTSAWGQAPQHPSPAKPRRS
jgi:hypothetical protein